MRSLGLSQPLRIHAAGDVENVVGVYGTERVPRARRQSSSWCVTAIMLELLRRRMEASQSGEVLILLSTRRVDLIAGRGCWSPPADCSENALLIPAIKTPARRCAHEGSPQHWRFP